ncbi:hypothetical protein [Natrinema sp. DC36]|uniref:hypothetical protein n=1 Tax=Natrinema sp. DC36 TaxID=2878680 RepID=UPI001CF0789F|nr:hypothetical protein [Natrinema sp. DC36]
MSSTDGTGSHTHADIANRLAVQLAFIIGAAAAINLPLSVLTHRTGLTGGADQVLVNLFVLWLAVRVVFAALDALLEAKLTTVAAGDGA